MSEPQHIDPALTSTPVAEDGGVRLELKPGGAKPGFVDGAWWPRSRDLRRELPEILAALSSRVGPVERVAFGRPGWDPTGRERLVTPTGRVSLDGFATFTPDAVWFVIAGRWQGRVCVLVIPPDTAPAVAERVLRRASAPDNVQSHAELLQEVDEGLPTATPAGVAG